MINREVYEPMEDTDTITAAGTNTTGEPSASRPPRGRTTERGTGGDRR